MCDVQSQIKYMSVKNDDGVDQLRNFNDDYKNAGWLSSIFYSWMTPLVMYVYKRKSLDDIKQCVQMPEEKSSQKL